MYSCVDREFHTCTCGSLNVSFLNTRLFKNEYFLPGLNFNWLKINYLYIWPLVCTLSPKGHLYASFHWCCALDDFVCFVLAIGARAAFCLPNYLADPPSLSDSRPDYFAFVQVSRSDPLVSVPGGESDLRSLLLNPKFKPDLIPSSQIGNGLGLLSAKLA